MYGARLVPGSGASPDQLGFFGVQAQDVFDPLALLTGGQTVGYSHRGDGRYPLPLRLELPKGEYEGAAFPTPPRIELSGQGGIGLGRWEDSGLATYSGVGVYRQDVTLTAEEAGRRCELDLGQVHVSAEVLVNGRSAGIRRWISMAARISPREIDFSRTILA